MMRWWALLATLTAVRPCAGLKCFVETVDCFPACTGLPMDACSFQNASYEQGSYERSSYELGMVDISEGDWLRWSCPRSLGNCRENGTQCSVGLAAQTAVECAPEETFCYDLFRQPQNSRYGKTAVWGFEAVHERGCASECVESNRSKLTGIGRRCCTEDLCNASGRPVAGLLASAVATLAVLQLAS